MKLIFSTQVETEHELTILAEKILSLVSKGSVILLSGGLSAGKTTLVANFCKTFGIDIVQSPTYSIHHHYSNRQVVIDHFDLYRLESEDELQSSGFFDLLHTHADYKFIEWPDRVKMRDYPLDRPIYKIDIRVDGINSRLIDIYQVN